MWTPKYKVKWYNVLFVGIGVIIGAPIWVVFKCTEAIGVGMRYILD